MGCHNALTLNAKNIQKSLIEKFIKYFRADTMPIVSSHIHLFTLFHSFGYTHTRILTDTHLDSLVCKYILQEHFVLLIPDVYLISYSVYFQVA